MAWPAVLMWAIAVPLFVLNLVYWAAVEGRWQDRFRRHCARKFALSIERGPRGYWRVSGSGSALRRFAIEWLQLCYFLAAMIVWSLALLRSGPADAEKSIIIP